MKTRVKAYISTLLFFVASSLSADTYELTAKELQPATTVNQLSSQLLTSKLNHGGVGNSLVSSVSLYYALSILERGAAGQSAELLQSFLMADAALAVQDVAPSLAENLVSSPIEGRPEVGHFQLANSIWSTNGKISGLPFIFSEQFQSDAEHYYQAERHSLDFLASGASKVFNDWADEKTNGLIPEIIDDLTLSEFVWVITNAAYFEGSWATSMKRIPKNSKYLFKSVDGDKIQTESIRSDDYKNNVLDQEDGSVAFSLPFIGRKYSFIAYVPSQEETDFKQWLLETGIQGMPGVIKDVLNNRSSVYQLTIQLPVFSFSDELAMRKSSTMTEDLGLTPLFTNQANLSPMVDKQKTALPLHKTQVGLIKQNTKIELDEKGVKAAAVTLIGGIKSTSVGPRLTTREIIVDRPFVFAIVENSTQTVLFNGVFTNPTE